MTTVGEWLGNTQLDAIDKSFMLESICKINKATQLIHPERLLSEKELCSLNEIAAKRTEGVPLPYLLGKQEFFGRDFLVNRSVLIPRADTECLVEWLLTNLPKEAVVCDLGTGSGCIGITLALERKDLKVWASDLSDAALKVAKQNAAHLRADVNFLEGSWLEPFPNDFKLDAIVSNPPYIRPDDTHMAALEFEPRNALTDESDGLEAYRKILLQTRIRGFLPKIIAVEHGWDQEEAVKQIFAANGFSNAISHKDYGGNSRYTVWKS